MISFESLSSVNSYVKQSQMKNKWQIKKATGNMEADGATTVSEAWRQNKLRSEHAQWDSTVEKLRKDNNDTSKLDEIRTKIQNGDSLSQDELSLLKEKDPQLYQEVQNRARKEKAYKRQLSQAKTKEEFQRIKTMKSAELVSRINFIKNDSAIPEEKKLGLYQSINEEMKDALKVEKEFINSGAYDALPTEEEKREVERAEREEKNPAETKNGESVEKTETEEETDQTGKTGKSDQTEAAGKSETERGTRTESTESERETRTESTGPERGTRRADTGSTSQKSGVSEKKAEQMMERVSMEQEPTEEARRKVHQSRHAKKYHYHSIDVESSGSGVKFSADA